MYIHMHPPSSPSILFKYFCPSSLPLSVRPPHLRCWHRHPEPPFRCRAAESNDSSHEPQAADPARHHRIRAEFSTRGRAAGRTRERVREKGIVPTNLEAKVDGCDSSCIFPVSGFKSNTSHHPPPREKKKQEHHRLLALGDSWYHIHIAVAGVRTHPHVSFYRRFHEF